ncbi:MAG: creatininase family protein [Clostridia bacterium]|nr:creatininase family protein [Clostridia bacterium]
MKINMETSYPKEVEQVKRENLPVFLPVGTMEYHSHHCPFGCDTLVANGIAEKVAEITGGMVLPPVWYGVASYAVGGPEKNTLNVDVDTMENYVYCILKSLFLSGFKKNIFIIIAHQTEDYMPMTLACMKAAKKLIMAELEEKNGYGWWGKKENADFYEKLQGSDSPWNKVRVIRLPYTKNCKNFGDHAGVHECSILEYLYPNSIKLDRLDASEDWFSETAVNISLEHGKKIVDTCVNDIISMINGEE